MVGNSSVAMKGRFFCWHGQPELLALAEPIVTFTKLDNSRRSLESGERGKSRPKLSWSQS
jgi:hypothetical protein